MQFLVVTGPRGREGAVLVRFQQEPVITLKGDDHQEIRTRPGAQKSEPGQPSQPEEESKAGPCLPAGPPGLQAASCCEAKAERDRGD